MSRTCSATSSLVNDAEMRSFFFLTTRIGLVIAACGLAAQFDRMRQM